MAKLCHVLLKTARVLNDIKKEDGPQCMLKSIFAFWMKVSMATICLSPYSSDKLHQRGEMNSFVNQSKKAATCITPSDCCKGL